MEEEEEVLKGERKRKNEGCEVYGRRRGGWRRRNYMARRKRRRERKGELYGEGRGGERGK